MFKYLVVVGLDPLFWFLLRKVKDKGVYLLI